MYPILSILERSANARTLYGIVVTITVAMMLIIGSGSLPMVLSKSSSHQNDKSSLHVPILPRGGIAGIGLSNLNGVHNQSSSTSLYSAPPPSASNSGGNISNAVTSSNNKVVMIGFDD